MTLALALAAAALLLLAGHTVHVHQRLNRERRDPITGLPTRAEFYRRARKEIERRRAVVILLDLDGFKPLNDRMGHAAGDAALARVAERMQDRLGPNALVARIGGDEFAAVIQSDYTTSLPHRLNSLAMHIGDPVPTPGGPAVVGGSVGAVHLGHCAHRDLPGAMHAADRQMYRAKENGGGHVSIDVPEHLPTVETNPVPRIRDDRPTSTLDQLSALLTGSRR